MKRLQKTLLAGLMATTLWSSCVQAKSSSNSGWTSAAVSAASMVAGIVISAFKSGETVMMIISNIDPAQVALEYMVLKEMKKLNVEWDPEPKDSYEQAAKSNSGAQNGEDDNPPGDFESATAAGAFPFQVSVLQNVGIESVGVGSDLSSLVADTARMAVLEGLAYSKPSDGSTSESSKSSGAGSCGAGYSICFNDLTQSYLAEVSTKQTQNEQYFGTAGVARSELALKAVQQGIVDDNGGVAGLVGTGKNTTAAMKIVALMNLELAQRLNLGNMLQGSTLTVEAARAFKKVTVSEE